MYLRMIRAQGMISNEITAIAIQFNDEDMPGIRQQPGYVAAALAVNPTRGGAVSMVFWDDEARMQESERLSDAARDRLWNDFRTRDPYRSSSYEVMFSDRIVTIDNAPVVPCLHLTRFERVSGSELSRVVDTAIRDAELDAADRGAEGTVVAANRADGIVAIMSFWETYRDMREVRLKYTGSIEGINEPVLDHFELVSASDLERVGPLQPVHG